MKSKAWKITAAVLLTVVIILLILVIIGFAIYPYGEKYVVPDDYPFRNWQYMINDDAKITEIAIPGSHDAAAANIDGSMLSVGTFLLACQNASIYEQLLCGSRYFDLRTMISDGELYGQHGDFKVQKFSTVISDIKRYLEEEEDFLILNFQHFTDDATSEKTYQAIKDELGIERLAVETTATLGELTVGDMRESGKRLVIIWGRSVIPNQRFLFPKRDEYLYSPYSGNIHSAGDERLIEEFPRYIENSAAFGGFFNLQCQRTWSSSELLMGPEQLEERFAEKASAYLGSLGGAELAAVNIVHRDFINVSKCREIISLNYRKGLIKAEYVEKFS